MLKQHFLRPPMGWNSYDCYDTTVTEDDVLRSARAMLPLKEYGWEYVVVDIQWYAADTGSQRDRFQYIPFSHLNMDEWGRLIPDPVKFPSSQGGKGFAPLAEKIHQMGLKFGIHIMRGIPRIAAHQHLPVLGAAEKADRVADPSSICGWNPDMYGVRHTADGQAYYDSIIHLYADWGVDFIKCDDICNTNLYPHNPYSAEKEIEMLSRAIGKVEREMVLSFSPGPAVVEKSWHYCQHANMWRITDDFWDKWDLLKDMFVRCERWQDHVREGCYPDCDMLPLGLIGKGFGHGEWHTNFTPEEQQTMMTLWCIFRSPLMLGADVTRLDSETMRLLTNREVLSLLDEGHTARQLARDDQHAVWVSRGADSVHVALFNLGDAPATISVPLAEVGVQASGAVDCWNHATVPLDEDKVEAIIPAHGVGLYSLML